MINTNEYTFTDLIEQKSIESFDKNDILYEFDDIINKIKRLKIYVPFDISNLFDIEETYNDIEIPKDFNDFYLIYVLTISNKNHFISFLNNTILNKINSNIDEIKLTNDILNKSSFKKSFAKFSSLCSISSLHNFIEEVNNGKYFKSLILILEQIKEKYYNKNSERIYAIYELMNTLFNIINNVILFWNKFFELFENDKPIYYEENIEENEESIEDFLFGTEVVVNNGNNKFKSPNLKNKSADNKNNIFNILSNIPKKINSINKRFKMFRTKAKNHFFYKKYIGRIEGLYERYSGEAKIIENNMKGDPVDILKNEAKTYITKVSNEFTKLGIQLIDLSKKISTLSDPKQSFLLIKKYCGIFAGEITKTNTIPQVMLKATIFKIAQIILKNNKIYGYTAEGMATNKKIPPANHTMVSLFIENPDEKPTEKVVSDIIKDVNSFKLIAKNEKEPIFTVSEVCQEMLSKGITKNDISKIKEYQKESREKFEQVKHELAARGNSKEDKKEINLMRKQNSNIWSGIYKSFEYISKMKNYMLELTDAYFIMMMRIDNLCKECVTSMLEVERMKKDERYNTGFKGTSLKQHKEYKQTEDNEKTKGEQESEKMEAEQNSPSSRAQLQERVNAIKEAMRR